MVFDSLLPPVTVWSKMVMIPGDNQLVNHSYINIIYYKKGLNSSFPEADLMMSVPIGYFSICQIEKFSYNTNLGDRFCRSVFNCTRILIWLENTADWRICLRLFSVITVYQIRVVSKLRRINHWIELDFENLNEKKVC